jgi:hypothetical protein
VRFPLESGKADLEKQESLFSFKEVKMAASQKVRCEDAMRRSAGSGHGLLHELIVLLSISRGPSPVNGRKSLDRYWASYLTV